MYFFCCIKQETFEILELCLCLFQLIFSFRSFSLLAIYKTASLSLKCKLEGGLPTFTRFYSFFQYFSIIFNIVQYLPVFFRKDGVSPKCKLEGGSPPFTRNVVKGRIVKPFVSIYIVSSSPRTTEILQRVHRRRRRERFSTFFKHESCSFLKIPAGSF